MSDQPSAGADILPTFFSAFAPALEDHRNSFASRAGDVAFLVDELADGVLVLEILIGRLHHDLGRFQPVLTPQTATLHSPRQDAVTFLEQFLGKFAVPFFGRDGHGEWNQVQAPLHRFVHIANRRFVVAGNHQLELRYILKKILPHEARRYLVATGDGFHLGFVPAPPLLSFDGGHKARAA